MSSMVQTINPQSAPTPIASDRHNAIFEKSETVINWLRSLIEKGHPLTIGVSLGKDSSACLVLFLEAIKRSVEDGFDVPQCYVSNSDTLIENPAMSFYVDSSLEQLGKFIEAHSLPIKIIRVTPSLSSTFVYATIGRGKLPRFTNLKHRECSIDWKVRPQTKALNSILKDTQQIGNKPLITILGTRFDESASRKGSMVDRGDGPTALVEQDNGSFTNACIADWGLQDVWGLLIACDSKREAIYSTFVENFDWTLKLYRDANEGLCGYIVGDQGNRSACSSRFGCSLCTVNGETDKSMEALISSDSEYSHLQPINDLRNYLIKTQFDLTKRDWAGRSLSKAGYVRIRPDNYSSLFRRSLLRYLLTMDVEEQERAENVAEDIASGAIPKTITNLRLAETQFQFVTPDLLLSVDFAWSLQRDFSVSFPACREWHEIYEMGKRYYVPDVEKTPRQPIPDARWFHAKTFDSQWGVDGLRDILGETINGKRKPGKAPYAVCKDPITGNDRKVIAHDVDDELSIDKSEACYFVTCEFENLYWDCLNSSPTDSLFYMLDRGLVKIAKGQISKYDFMARRAQYYTRMKESLNVASLNSHMLDNSISDSEHKALLDSIRVKPVVDDNQHDLFAIAV